jgi:hypothetical protein
MDLYYDTAGLPVSWVFVWNTGGVFALTLVIRVQQVYTGFIRSLQQF